MNKRKAKQAEKEKTLPFKKQEFVAGKKGETKKAVVATSSVLNTMPY